MRGIRLTVLRSTFGDCTNGGMTATARYVTLIDARITEDDPHTYEPSDRAPAVRLTHTGHDYEVLVPVDPYGGDIGPMSGGNYAVGDYGSRHVWKRLTGGFGALPVHDRFETQAQYDALSI